LQAYVLVKGLARNPVGTVAASHAGNLRRDLGRSGKGKKKTAPKPAPAPTVPPGATTTGSPAASSETP